MNAQQQTLEIMAKIQERLGELRAVHSESAINTAFLAMTLSYFHAYPDQIPDFDRLLKKIQKNAEGPCPQPST